MDIMGPKPDEEIAPAPWVIAWRNLDIRSSVSRILRDNPGASPDQIVGMLADWSFQANGALVAQQVQEFRRQPRPETISGYGGAAGEWTPSQTGTPVGGA
jgi:hypothetical protein